MPPWPAARTKWTSGSADAAPCELTLLLLLGQLEGHLGVLLDELGQVLRQTVVGKVGMATKTARPGQEPLEPCYTGPDQELPPSCCSQACAERTLPVPRE